MATAGAIVVLQPLKPRQCCTRVSVSRLSPTSTHLFQNATDKGLWGKRSTSQNLFTAQSTLL